MLMDRELSLLQQKTGRNKLLLFSFLNGIALTFITGNVFSLFLLKIGFSSSAAAVILSLGYAGTIFALTGKWIIAKLGASSAIRISWFFCGVSAILLSIIPFAYQHGFVSSTGMLFIGIVFFIFCVFKSIGTGAIPPLMGEFTDEDNKGKFISKFFLLFNIATIIAILIVIFLFSSYRTSLIYQILIFSGGILKVCCSFTFVGIKESPIPMKSAKSTKTDKSLSLIWNNKRYRNFLIFKSLARAGMIIIIPISILALKVTYEIHDETALIFACVQLLGGFFTVYFYGVISDYTGPKPLIIINIVGLFIICILWLYAPSTFLWEYCVVIFLIGGSCLFGLDSSLNHYYLTIISSEDQTSHLLNKKYK